MAKRPRLPTTSPPSYPSTEPSGETNSAQLNAGRPIFIEERDGYAVFQQPLFASETAVEPGNRAQTEPSPGKPGPKPVGYQYIVRRDGASVVGTHLDGLFAKLDHKIRRQHSIDDQLLTMQSGLDVGLDEACIRRFCADNELDPDSSIARADLRRVVLNNLSLNMAQYQAGLARVRIVLRKRG